MGKGSNTTTTNQNQTYTPTGASQIQGALTQAQNAAQLPFNIPQAPVAGFSQDQLSAFNTVNNSQGIAQPYINQANNYFQQSAQQPNVAAFYNPMASAVTSQLNNIFGQQASQNTGQLTQAAGGVGADRIAVGQGNLANQQGLAAGQTYAGLYGQAQQAAQQQQSLMQSAGYGTAALGSQAQNAALTGAQAQLGTGGLQQQLQQAQLNSPYQQQLAQAAFPYQQAQFLAGITGALAPGLGGTTTGQGTTTGAAPSMLSQILGLGTAGVGAAGSLGAFGGSPSFGGGSAGKGDAYGGSASNPLAGLSASDYGAGFARGGAANPWAFADGGSPFNLPEGFNDKPINVDQQSIIPQQQLQAAQVHVPNLNLNPPAPSGKSGAGDAAAIVGDVTKIASMFLARGGRTNPWAYAEGGSPSPLDEMDWPYGPKNGPSPLDNARWPSGPIGGPSDVVNPDDPIRMPDAEAVQAWRNGTPAMPAAFASDNASPSAAPTARMTASAAPPSAAAPARQDPEAPSEPDASSKLAQNPWTALMAAGLGIAGGTSPFAMTNIGQGALQGVKVLQEQQAASQKDTTIAQAAKRLEQEAKHHEDQYTRMTPYQTEEVGMAKRKEALEELKPVTVGTDLMGHPIMARRDPNTGDYINVLTGKKAEDPRAQFPGAAFKAPGGDEASLPENARFTEGVNVPTGVNPEILQQLPPQLASKIRAVDEGRQSLTSIPMKERGEFESYLNMYDPNWDQTVYDARKKQNSDLTTNGNAGKMIMAVNQLLPHLNTLSKQAEDLHNSGYPAANTIKNWWLTRKGDPQVKKFEEVREVASMDAARLLRGSGQMAEKDIDFWRTNLASAGSPQQLQEQIELLANDLMGARISSIEHSYQMNMRMKPPDFVDPHARSALDEIKQRTARYAKPQGAAQPAAPAGGAAAPAPAAAPQAKPPVVYQNSHEYHLQPDGSYK